MALYTNIRPLFTSRKTPKGVISDYVYDGPMFFKMLNKDERMRRSKTDASMWYQDFDTCMYDVVNMDPGQDMQLFKFRPRFLVDIMEKDVFFPSILPDSEYFNNPQQSFIGLHLRDVDIQQADIVSANTPLGVDLEYNKLEAVELLIGQEKVVVLSNEVKLVNSPQDRIGRSSTTSDQ